MLARVSKDQFCREAEKCARAGAGSVASLPGMRLRGERRRGEGHAADVAWQHETARETASGASALSALPPTIRQIATSCACGRCAARLPAVESSGHPPRSSAAGRRQRHLAGCFDLEVRRPVCPHAGGVGLSSTSITYHGGYARGEPAAIRTGLRGQGHVGQPFQADGTALKSQAGKPDLR